MAFWERWDSHLQGRTVLSWLAALERFRLGRDFASLRVLAGEDFRLGFHSSARFHGIYVVS